MLATLTFSLLWYAALLTLGGLLLSRLWRRSRNAKTRKRAVLCGCFILLLDIVAFTTVFARMTGAEPFSTIFKIAYLPMLEFCDLGEHYLQGFGVTIKATETITPLLIVLNWICYGLLAVILYLAIPRKSSSSE